MSLDGKDNNFYAKSQLNQDECEAPIPGYAVHEHVRGNEECRHGAVGFAKKLMIFCKIY